MSWIETETADPTEILVSGHGSEKRMSITIASGAGVLVKGTAVGQYNTGTNSGTFGSYNNTASSGLNECKGILTDKVDASSSGAQATMYTHGTFYRSKLTGLDSAGETDLKNCDFVNWDPNQTE